MDALEVIRADGAAAVVRADSVADPAGLATTLAGAGVRAVEFTFTIGGVLDAIAAAAETDAVVGAGTVLTPEQAADAAAAGARFVVSPVLEPALCEAVGVPVVLAGLTPTELRDAVRAGADAVKLFPARHVGPGYLRDVLGPLPELPVMPSGGVDADNAADWLAAGAVAVFAGSSLVPAAAAGAGDHDEVAERARALVRGLG